MKVLFLAAMLFATGVVGTAIYKRASSLEPNKSETITVTTPSVTSTTQSNSNAYSVPTEGATQKQIAKQTVNKKRVVYFLNEFSYESVSQAVTELKKLEAESSDPIYLLIDSPGGSVLDGGTLISQMEASKAPVHTVCIRLCASMAAMTHSYGKQRYSLDRAILMYHPASAGVQGQLPNMLSLLNTIQRYVDKMNANLVSRSKMPKAEFDSLVAYELWIDSEDALKRGLIDGIVSLNVDNTPSQVSALPVPKTEPEEGTKPRINFQWISPYAKQLWKR